MKKFFGRNLWIIVVAAVVLCAGAVFGISQFGGQQQELLAAASGGREWFTDVGVTGTLTTDTIAEYTGAAGVTIDGAKLKDGGLIGSYVKPAADSTTAIQLQNAAGTSVLNVDTTNARVGIGTSAPTASLNIVHSTSVSSNSIAQAIDVAVNHANVFGALASYGLDIHATQNSSGAGTHRLYGLALDVTGACGGGTCDERAIWIGSGWDYGIYQDVITTTNYLAGPTYANRPVQIATSNKSLTDTLTRELATNQGAGTAITFTLSSAAVGLEYCFYTFESQTIYVDPATGDQIHVLTNAAGDRISNATPGDSICLVAIDATYWVATTRTGTWADAN